MSLAVGTLFAAWLFVWARRSGERAWPPRQIGVQPAAAAGPYRTGGVVPVFRHGAPLPVQFAAAICLSTCCALRLLADSWGGALFWTGAPVIASISLLRGASAKRVDCALAVWWALAILLGITASCFAPLDPRYALLILMLIAATAPGPIVVSRLNAPRR
jgi:hypothetical protein